ncbi:MAG: serine/threonine protein kinase, partial [Anaerolineales bacterium]
MTQPTWIGYSLNNRYQVKELLGQGGMSSVYRAYDPQLRRDVAIKIIHPHLSDDPKFVRRFEEEAAAVARLRHPNIRQVFDSGHDADTFYMVLEFLPGETLKERLNSYAQDHQLMPLNEVITITQQICEAVAYAHRHGVIHRDIKPSNVIISEQGEAVLTDFGIAKMVGIEEFTATGAVIGTAAYISPEQIQGEGVDHRTDIYAIGVMLFEMVSGTPPFEADSVLPLMMKHINEPIPDLRQRVPALPPEMIAIIEKSLAKDPSKRYQTADDIAANLGSLSAPESSIKDDTLIEDTLLEKMVLDATIQDEPPFHPQPLLQTVQL